MLKEETLLKIRNVYQREYHDLPLAKDLPRLAKFISICNEDGVRLSYVESKRLDIESYIKEKGTDFKIFYQVRRVLLTLCLALEGQAKCLETDRALLQLLEGQDCLLPPVINSFLEKHFGGDTGKVVRVLKCVNQAAIAPSLIELKTGMGMDNTTKDVAGTWRIFIVLTTDSLHVTHIKQEICIKNKFLLEWELTFTLSYNQMDQIRKVAFNVIDLSFNAKTTSKKMTEVKGTVKTYLDKEIEAEVLTGKPQTMLESIPDAATTGNGQNGSSYTTWPGEVVYLKMDRIAFVHHQLQSQENSIGTLYEAEKCAFSVPLATITRCTKKKDCFELFCRDFRNVYIIFSSKEESKQFLEIYNCLLPSYPRQIFADAYCKGLIRNLGPVQSSSYALLKNGWRCYNMEEEFDRMKMTSEWRISDLNIRHQLCGTYPGLLAVPRSVSDAELLMSCRYRIGGRVPVLSWIHKNKSMLCHGATAISDASNSVSKEDEKVIAAIIRTTQAQPPTATSPSIFRREHSVMEGGMSRKASRKDKLLHKLKKSSSVSKHRRDSSNPSHEDSLATLGHQFYIVDLLFHGQMPPVRDYSNGFPGIPYQTVGTACIYMDSLAELKESYLKLQRMCTAPYQEEDHWLSNLDNTRWLAQVQNIMEGAYRIVEIMDAGGSLFLSCPGSGWDRGCQISSLAQLWMDPYYRTVEGFAVLIEKEWLSFGHPFLDRGGFLTRDTEPTPVFLQWLDAVWQTLRQFPNHFEFNNVLLVEIAESTFSGVYGSFLFNNEQSRRVHLARMNTESFWTHVKDNFQYQNPFYVHSYQTLLTSCSSRILSVWTSFYLRWFERIEVNGLPNSSQSLTGNDVLGMYAKPTSMSEAELLQRHIESLEKALLGIQKQLQTKYEVQKLITSGFTLEEAVESAIQASKGKGEVYFESSSPITPDGLRRKSRFGSLICSHRASLSRNSTEPAVMNPEFRRASVDDTLVRSGAEEVNERQRRKRKRKVASAYMKKEEMDVLLLKGSINLQD